MLPEVFGLAAVIAAVTSIEINDHDCSSSPQVHFDGGVPHVIQIEQVTKPGHFSHDFDYETPPPPTVKCNYGVTVGDSSPKHEVMSHHESRDGEMVKGYYEMKEPDGSVRKVKYQGEKKKGYKGILRHYIALDNH